MNPKEVIKAIECCNGSFPEEQIDYIMENPELFLPGFLDLIKDASKNPRFIVEKDDSYFLHIYALYFLAEFRVKEAYPYVLELFSFHIDIVDYLFNDIVTEGLSQIIASVADDNLAPIIDFIKDDSLGEFVRSAALGSIAILYNEGIISRDFLIDVLLDLFNTLESEPSYVWYELAYISTSLYATEFIDKIKLAYKLGLIDEEIDRMDDLLNTFSWDREKVLEEFKNNRDYQIKENLVYDFKNWACFGQKFSAKDLREMKHKLKELSKTETKTSSASNNSNIKATKIGRNDPCPCGSGKKFKKCCGI
ncbi:MAG: DUF1186 domain-containing protein [Spirochaetales bacterium]|nr:DUF1186 domain-containing protein [Spirochaetales bacterium]